MRDAAALPRYQDAECVVCDCRPAGTIFSRQFPRWRDECRELDWSKTQPLGPVERWPLQSLRTSVSTCLDCAFPIIIWWGRELVVLYNDEYKTALGPAKHPSALGLAVPGVGGDLGRHCADAFS